MQPARCTAVLAAAAALLCACGGPPKPAQVSGTVEASTSVNPSVSKRPSPVLVRVYELKSINTFNSADFVSLYQRDQAELAADLVGRDEYMLAPGEARPFTKILSPETRFIGVMVAYRDIERAKWRASVPVLPGKKHEIVIRAEELSVSAIPKK
jgi:type VI secretion system protein VasD